MNSNPLSIDPTDPPDPPPPTVDDLRRQIAALEALVRTRNEELRARDELARVALEGHEDRVRRLRHDLAEALDTVRRVYDQAQALESEIREKIAALPPVSTVEDEALEFQALARLTGEDPRYHAVLVSSGPPSSPGVYGSTVAIPTIKLIREVTFLGLKESKLFAETLPQVLKGNLTLPEARAIREAFRQVGAKVELRSVAAP